MSYYHDDSTVATNPGGVSLCKYKLSKFKDDLSFFKRFFLSLQYPFSMLNEHLKLGDSRAAVILETKNRLVVSAYTDELDCVALLTFPLRFVSERGLKVGDRLLTINTYTTGFIVADDLECGTDSYNRYNNFYPLIADFLSDDYQIIKRRKLSISEHEWGKAFDMGKAKLGSKSATLRDGSPYASGILMI